MRLHARLLTDGRSTTLRAGRSGRSGPGDPVVVGSPFMAALPATPSAALPATGAATLPAAFLAALVATTLLTMPLAAQDVRILTRPDADRRVIIREGQPLDSEGRVVFQAGRMMDDRPMIGVTTAAESERGDTLGLMIESVQRGSPAEKAGLKAGDRVQAVNGVSLRADRADAGEDDYSGVLTRRLQREVQRTAPGASIDLRVLTGGQSRTVKVTPVKASDLETEERAGFSWTGQAPDRAVLGVTVAGTGSARDTLGVFVQSVVNGGPAEKAGIVEGDRIAAINGVSLRVAREDAEDEAVGASRAERLSREVGKLKAGDAAELTVVTGGRSRTVRVTTGKASDLPEGGESMLFMRAPMEEALRGFPRRPEMLEGGMQELPAPRRPGLPDDQMRARIRRAPNVRILEPEGGVRMDDAMRHDEELRLIPRVTIRRSIRTEI